MKKILFLLLVVMLSFRAVGQHFPENCTEQEKISISSGLLEQIMESSAVDFVICKQTGGEQKPYIARVYCQDWPTMYGYNKVMMLHQISYPFSNIQVELLKLYSTGISDAYLLELKNVISQFLFEKARNRADEIWTEKNYNQETIQQWLSE